MTDMMRTDRPSVAESPSTDLEGPAERARDDAGEALADELERLAAHRDELLPDPEVARPRSPEEEAAAAARADRGRVAAAQLLGIKPTEVVGLRRTGRGLEIGTADGAWYVVADRPDANGRTGLMLLGPRPARAGRTPVYVDHAERAAELDRRKREQATETERNAPWWAKFLPRSMRADHRDAPPWEDDAAADPAVAQLRAAYDQALDEVTRVGVYVPPEKDPRVKKLAKELRQREAEVASAWIEAHPFPPDEADVERNLAVYKAGWWLLRAEEARERRDIDGWERARATAEQHVYGCTDWRTGPRSNMDGSASWLSHHGIALPDMDTAAVHAPEVK
jgi:hypothetical protein